MNIRKLDDLSKDELIDLIKHEREACGQLVPISVEELLEALEAMVDMVRMDGFGSYQALDIADETIKKARGEL